MPAWMDGPDECPVCGLPYADKEIIHPPTQLGDGEGAARRCINARYYSDDPEASISIYSHPDVFYDVEVKWPDKDWTTDHGEGPFRYLTREDAEDQAERIDIYDERDVRVVEVEIGETEAC